MRVTRAWADWQGAKFVRFGDNMRYVAVTEGDKVAAEAKLGYAVNFHGGRRPRASGQRRHATTPWPTLCAEYEELYDVAAELRKGGARHESLRDGARIELGLRAFLEPAASRASPTPSRTCTA